MASEAQNKTVNAELLDKMRQDFVANVSHELRTPLTVIHGYLETLLDQTDDDHPWHEILMQMYQQSENMEKLVADLLLLARLETDQPTIDKAPVAVASMLKNICEEAKVLSGDKQHQFNLELDYELNISGQERELRSAFSNIIFNAVNYTPANGNITVKWYCDGNKIKLAVTDTGIGIEQKHIPRLTERFYRVDKARSRSKGGTGLGLAIIKHVLLRHHAQLQIESEVSKGSTFTCVFDGV